MLHPDFVFYSQIAPAKLQAKHGTVLVVVDQPASIGALPLAIARDMGKVRVEEALHVIPQQISHPAMLPRLTDPPHPRSP
ncbi:hypothetical protein [Streptomyces violaceus]|uniref:Uncharacterized protein n=1 Tax=Streptomyces violaceus TaxID=1936 RepID=A0ABY9UMC8_STRVL|nr:hypothetical protein [Streptomyces janthinus]WND24044.1 hypothetical protein RI060_21825 [Streptomyces janthinus]